MLAALAVGASVLAQAPARHVDRVQLMRDVTTLAAPAFEGRRHQTPGGLKARQWVAGQFAAIGLTPAAEGGYVQLPAGNVIGRVGGTGGLSRILVVTAHFDHLGVRDGQIYHGADDNASGTAVLLAAARHFKAQPPRHSMLFAALDGEEGGHLGARALVGSSLIARDRVALNVNLDMVSRNDRNTMYAAGTYHSPWLRPILEDVQTRSSVTIRFGHDRPDSISGGVDDWTRLSDHAAFHDAGIPFVYFGVENHPDYHRPTDTADKIDPRFFGDAADTIVEAIRTLDRKVD